MIPAYVKSAWTEKSDIKRADYVELFKYISQYLAKEGWGRPTHNTHVESKKIIGGYFMNPMLKFHLKSLDDIRPVLDRTDWQKPMKKF